MEAWGAIALYINFVIIAMGCFASIAFLLHELAPPLFRPAVREVDHGALADFLLWQLLDSIPGLKVPETIRWAAPLTYERSGAGWLVLLFKVMVIVPVVSGIGHYLREEGTASEISAARPLETITPGPDPSPKPSRRVDLPRMMERLHALRGAHLRAYDLDDIDQKYKEAVGTYSMVGGGIIPGMLWYRGRVVPAEGLPNLHECIYRKDQRGFGRANTPGQPVFYGSRNHTTVLAKLRPARGDCVQVIAARVREGMQLKSVTIGEIEHCYNAGRSVSGYDHVVDGVDEMLRGSGDQDELLGRVLCDAFLAEQFGREVNDDLHDYKLTAVVAQGPIQSGGALLYPSVRLPGGLNIAVGGEAFNQYFEVLYTWLYQVERYLGYGVYSVALKRESCAFAADGAIDWNSPKRIGGRASLRLGWEVPTGVVGWRIPAA